MLLHKNLPPDVSLCAADFTSIPTTFGSYETASTWPLNMGRSSHVTLLKSSRSLQPCYPTLYQRIITRCQKPPRWQCDQSVKFCEVLRWHSPTNICPRVIRCSIHSDFRLRLLPWHNNRALQVHIVFSWQGPADVCLHVPLAHCCTALGV